MSSRSDSEAAGGISLANQEDEARERAEAAEIDAQVRELDDTLKFRALKLAVDIGANNAAPVKLILHELRRTLKEGVAAAQSGALAAKLMETER